MVYKQAVTMDTTMQEIPKASKPVRNANVKRTNAAAALCIALFLVFESGIVRRLYSGHV